MSDDATRQHYKLATGKGLDSEPSKKGSPGYAKGGHVHKGVKHAHTAKGHMRTKGSRGKG